MSQSETGKQDMLKAIETFAATYNIAMKQPDMYLNNASGTLDAQQAEVEKFFSQNIGTLLRLSQYLDSDTMNQMMDKRFEKFKEQISELNKLEDSNLQLASQLIKCTTFDPKKNGKEFKGDEITNGRTLTASEKIQLCEMLLVYQTYGKENGYYDSIDSLSIDDIRTMATSGKVNIIELKNQITEAVLLKAGISEEELAELPSEKKGVNEEYSYTLLANISPNYLRILKEAVSGNFSEFITDTSNIYGQTNARTQEIFANRGMNYENWVTSAIPESKIKLAGQEMTIKLWDRNPLEDLFIGSKTTCCTAPSGGHGDATPLYLANTAINVIELYDTKGNVIGMSRIFMAEVDGKPSLIMDNFELNNTSKKDIPDTELIALREAYFDYAKALAQSVTGIEDTPVYFSSNYADIPTEGLTSVLASPKMIGELSQNDIYINSGAEKDGEKKIKLWLAR